MTDELERVRQKILRKTCVNQSSESSNDALVAEDTIKDNVNEDVTEILYPGETVVYRDVFQKRKQFFERYDIGVEDKKPPVKIPQPVKEIELKDVETSNDQQALPATDCQVDVVDSTATTQTPLPQAVPLEHQNGFQTIGANGLHRTETVAEADIFELPTPTPDDLLHITANEAAGTFHDFYANFLEVCADSVDIKDNRNSCDSGYSIEMPETPVALGRMNSRAMLGTYTSHNETIKIKKESEKFQTATDAGISRRARFEKDLLGTIKEFIDSEEAYLNGLQFVYENYLPRVFANDAPPSLKDKLKYLFGNLVEIYDFHREVFHPELLECNMQCESISKLIIKYKNDLNCYITYAVNQPLSLHLLTEYRSFFGKVQLAIGDPLGLASYLIKPIQRLVKYRQLMERMVKNLERLNLLSQTTFDTDEDFESEVVQQMISLSLGYAIEAETLLTELQQQSNDVLMIPFVKKCPFVLSRSIPLIRTGKLHVKNRKSQVFLFDSRLVFTEPQGNDEWFLYKYDVSLDSLKALKVKPSNNQFSITFDNEEGTKKIILEASTQTERNDWYTKLLPLFQLHEERRNLENRKLPYIKNCKIDIFDQGHLLKQGTLEVKRSDSTRFYNREIILFEKILIFTSVLKNGLHDTFEYEDSIQIDNLIMSVSSSPTDIVLCCTQKGHQYSLFTKSVQEKKDWSRIILDFLLSDTNVLKENKSEKTTDTKRRTTWHINF